MCITFWYVPIASRGNAHYFYADAKSVNKWETDQQTDRPTNPLTNCRVRYTVARSQLKKLFVHYPSVSSVFYVVEHTDGQEKKYIY